MCVVILIGTAMLSRAQTFTVIHAFTGINDGASPDAGVVFDPSGNLYGTTFGGSFKGNGVVYEVNSRGSEQVLHYFLYREGIGPDSVPLLDSAGNLYGTNSEGGPKGLGTVFRWSKSEQLTVVFAWGAKGGVFDGTAPRSGLIRDVAGNLYGTTSEGGAQDNGTVYKLDLTSKKFTQLHSFGPPPDGSFPFAALFQGSDGSLYGTTEGGGTFGWGTIFKIDPSSGTETVLYNFTNSEDGAYPAGSLIQDGQGLFYGTAYQGGTLGFGTIFEFDASSRVLTTLHSFGTANPDGSFPDAGVVMDGLGNLYGTTTVGGTLGFGTIYKVDESRDLSVLHNFSWGTDGAFPYAGLTLHGGSVYGTTQQGGDPECSCGVVFKITP